MKQCFENASDAAGLAVPKGVSREIFKGRGQWKHHKTEKYENRRRDVISLNQLRPRLI